MKTKIFKLSDWNALCQKGEVYEEDLTNGVKDHLAIECRKTNCRAKIWNYPFFREGEKEIGFKPTLCRVCLDHWKRRVGLKGKRPVKNG